MAQGLVGVGGVPRNIAEIKVGVGGVRTVTEAYVGVGGAPRLCWSGNRWANKLYSTFSVRVNETDCVNLYQIDLSSFAATLVNRFVNAYSARTGGGFKQLYRMGWNFQGLSTIDMKTWAQVFYKDNFAEQPYSNVERRGAYLYYRQYRNQYIEILDANTYAKIQTTWTGLETFTATPLCGANSAGFYARGWINNDGRNEGVYRVDDIQGAPVKILVYLTSSLKGGWSFAVTDTHLFESEIGNAVDASLKKVDINTGSVVQAGTTKADTTNGTNIFSPKKTDR